MTRGKKYIFYLALGVLGALAGFAYYYFIGCQLGSCSIKSDPIKMTLFGGAIGFLVGNIIW